LRRIQFDFEIDGVRFRPTLPWAPTPANLEQAQKLNARIKAQIEAGTFVFSDTFPKFKGLRKLPGSVSAKSCGEVFDDCHRPAHWSQMVIGMSEPVDDRRNGSRA
jgi:hypothetical protein